MNIFITGASRGIGRAIALEFAKTTKNTVLFLTYHMSTQKILELEEEIKSMNRGHEVVPILMDVGDRESIEETFEWIRRTANWGHIDILINNAGIVKDKTLKKMTYEEWDDVIYTNLTGVFNVTKATIPLMRAGGCIINITSIIGIMGNFGQANYAASKAGVIAFTKSLAKELARDKIRVNAVAAGFVDTDMTASIPDEIKEKIKERILLKRFATPKEIAKFVVWLSTHGTYCTSQVYIVDGGMYN